MDKDKEEKVGARPQADQALVASDGAPAGLHPPGVDPSRVALTMNFASFVQRLEVFAESYCRVKPSLGMIGELFWVMGLDDFQFILTPRDSGRLPKGGDPVGAPCEASQSGDANAAHRPNPSPERTPHV